MSRSFDATVLQKAIDQAFNAVVVTTGSAADPTIVYANPAFYAMTGYALDELLGRNPKMLQGTSTDRSVIDGLRTALHEGTYWEGETINYRKDGTPYQVRWNISPVFAPDGSVANYVSVQQDVSARAAAARERRLLIRALDAASDAIAVLDPAGRIEVASDALTRMTGHPVDALKGRPLVETLFAEPDEARREEALRRLAGGDTVREIVELRRADGSTFPSELAVRAGRDDGGSIAHLVLIVSDASERLAREGALRERAERDALTGVATRRAGEEAHALLHQRTLDRQGSYAALLFDIDRFKAINDGYGHPAGDRVLRAVAQALAGGVREGDQVVRWGGEEFLVLLADADGKIARRSAERLRAAVAALHDDEVGAITISVGAAVVAPGEAPADLVARADEALYAAKRAGRDRVVMAEAPAAD
jgi:diguanylate cyclase (GGDEF)-like protein/PAS domain S-box-containing protein